MNIEDFREYCLSKNKVTEEFPFDEVTLVFKVCNKLFALTGLDNPEFAINLKCDPEWAEELRETYDGVIVPGYHMNKKHWNTVYVNGSIPEKLLRKLIDHSYSLVVKGLPKNLRDTL